MRRYNKQQVMRDAHRFYGSEFHRRGRSWSDCLKAAWIWEHDAVRAREEKAARLDAMIAASWIAHKEGVNQRRDERAWEGGLTSDEISKAMGYGTGRYCGD